MLVWVTPAQYRVSVGMITPAQYHVMWITPAQYRVSVSIFYYHRIRPTMPSKGGPSVEH